MGGSSGGGGGTTNTTTVQKSEPWSGIQPYLLQIAQASGGLQPRSYYPGQTVFDYSQPSQAYMGALLDRAQSGSPEYNASSKALTDTLSGAYLGGNPYADEAFGSASKQIRNQVDAAMARSGRGLTNAAHQGLMTEQLGDLANQFYFQNYANERQNQMNALGYAPEVMQMGMEDLAGYQTVGQAIEAKQYELAQDLMNRWNFAQNEPYQYLSDKASIIQGAGGQYGTQTATGASTAPGVKRDTTSQIVGGLATAAGIAAMFSSRKLKKRRGPVKTGEALEALRSLPVDRWTYLGDNRVHMGTYAEDFNAAFGVGDEHPSMISMIDMHGAELAAIKELGDRLDRLEKRKT